MTNEQIDAVLLALHEFGLLRGTGGLPIFEEPQRRDGDPDHEECRRIVRQKLAAPEDGRCAG